MEQSGTRYRVVLHAGYLAGFQPIDGAERRYDNHVNAWKARGLVPVDQKAEAAFVKPGPMHINE